MVLVASIRVGGDDTISQVGPANSPYLVRHFSAGSLHRPHSASPDIDRSYSSGLSGYCDSVTPSCGTHRFPHVGMEGA